jgi:hypothetical protein
MEAGAGHIHESLGLPWGCQNSIRSKLQSSELSGLSRGSSLSVLLNADFMMIALRVA